MDHDAAAAALIFCNKQKGVPLSKINLPAGLEKFQTLLLGVCLRGRANAHGQTASQDGQTMRWEPYGSIYARDRGLNCSDPCILVAHLHRQFALNFTVAQLLNSFT